MSVLSKLRHTHTSSLFFYKWFVFVKDPDSFLSVSSVRDLMYKQETRQLVEQVGTRRFWKAAGLMIPCLTCLYPMSCIFYV